MTAMAGVGTKIYLTKDGTVLIILPSKSENYIPQEGMSEIKGVDSIDINIPADDIIMAKINIHSKFTPIKAVINNKFESIEAKPSLFMCHPKTGNYEEVEVVKFKSGEEWSVKNG